MGIGWRIFFSFNSVPNSISVFKDTPHFTNTVRVRIYCFDMGSYYMAIYYSEHWF